MRSSGGQNSCVMEVKDFGGTSRQTNCPVTTAWTPVTLSNIAVVNGQATIGFFTSNSQASQWVDIDRVEFTRNDVYNGVVSGGVYKLVNTNSGKALEVDAWGTTNGSNVQIWTEGANQANQLWQITYVGEEHTSSLTRTAAKRLMSAGQEQLTAPMFKSGIMRTQITCIGKSLTPGAVTSSLSTHSAIGRWMSLLLAQPTDQTFKSGMISEMAPKDGSLFALADMTTPVCFISIKSIQYTGCPRR